MKMTQYDGETKIHTLGDGRTLRQALLAIAAAGIAATISGCFSVHTQKDPQPQVIVVPNNPAPPPAP